MKSKQRISNMDVDIIELAKETSTLHKTSPEIGFVVMFEFKDLRKFCKKLLKKRQTA